MTAGEDGGTVRILNAISQCQYVVERCLGQSLCFTYYVRFLSNRKLVTLATRTVSPLLLEM